MFCRMKWITSHNWKYTLNPKSWENMDLPNLNRLHLVEKVYLFKLSAFPFSIILAVAGSILSSTIRMHIPRASIPRRPARPLICMYSPLDIHLNLSPSNLRTFVNTTVLAGMFNPILKVSVANKHWKKKSLNLCTYGRRKNSKITASKHPKNNDI